MSALGRMLAPWAVAGVAALLAPAPAGASTASLVFEEPVPGVEDEGTYSLDVVGAEGEGNDLLVFGDEGGYTVRDAGATLSAGPGCETVDAHEVRCRTDSPAAAQSVVMDGGDSGDRLEAGAVPGIGLLPGPNTVELRGGTGDDVLVGGGAHELLLGGSGSDRASGGGGFDRLDGGAGPDTLDGGAALDRVSYQARTRPVVVDLAEGRGGEAGEGDALAAIEEVVGGRASDRIAGDRAANVLIGGVGSARDVLRGRGGGDTLTGHRVDGGPGADTLDGRRVSCGAGRDVLYRGIFRTRGPYPAACETVQAVFVILTARPLSVTRRRAVFGVRCRVARCRGRLELRDRTGRVGAARFRNPSAPSGMRRVSIPLARRPAARVVTLRVSGVSAFHRDHFRTRLR